tara:strand:- start:15677 stop:17023 length:1347 start_codon:yes stop_codon:yes gene_type:complete
MDFGLKELSTEAEREIAGILMRHPEMCEVVGSRLFASEQFLDKNLGKAVDYLVDAFAAGVPIGEVTAVVGELRKAGLLDGIGGKEGVLKILHFAPATTAHLDYNISQVVSLHRKRLQAGIATELSHRSHDVSSDARDDAAWAEARLSAIHADNRDESAMMLSDLMGSLADQMESDLGKSQQMGVPTGFSTVDEATGGYFPGEITVLGAWTSIGKTAFALQTAMFAARASDPRSVLMLSLEMREFQIAHRIAASELGLSTIDLRSGSYDSRDVDAVRSFAEQSTNVRLGIYPARRAPVRQIRSLSKIFRANHGLDLLVVDYLQLIEPENRRADRHVQVQQISNDLKSLAMELNIPVLALAQLNREGEGTAKPTTKNLRESAGIGNDADSTWFIHRPTRQSTEAELIVDKNRQGPPFTMPMRYDGSRFTFHAVEAKAMCNYEDAFEEYAE